MKNKYRQKGKKDVFRGALRIILFILLAFAAIRLGILGGNALSKTDSDLIEQVDVNSFKMTLNQSFPLIDAVYNSGNISVSISGEIKNLIETIFSFDLSKPMTVLNSQSPILYTYYNKVYLQHAENGGDGKDKEEIGYKIDYPENGDNPQKEQTSQPSPEGASSISTQEDSDETKKHQSDKEVTYDKISVQNETKYKIDSEFLNKLLNEPLKFKFDRKGPKVLIYHTHTTEGYLKDISELNKAVANRTEDVRYNVVRVGDEIAQSLNKKFGIEVIHNGKIHDEPSTNGAYARSLETVSKILKSYPSIKIALDIHRDGLDDKKLRTVTTVNGKNAARIMFVVGTNATGLNHPNWRENLKLAVKLQDKINGKYPGLAKPIYISENRYNQHLTLGTLIIEVGGDGNTIGECVESAKYIAEAISQVVK